MAGLIFRRRIILPLLIPNSPISYTICNFCSNPSRILDKDNESNPSTINSIETHLSPFLSNRSFKEGDFKIELVDSDIWNVSSSLAQAWKDTDRTTSKARSFIDEPVDETVNSSTSNDNEVEEADFDDDDIQDMRIRGNLFYKIDRDSREYEEYNFDFHRKKTSKKPRKEEDQKEPKKKENPNLVKEEKISKKLRNEKLNSPSPIRETENFDEVKKLRTQTFNQLTGPYHEPFCLDIYVSKSSIRACIIHRATSKVVAVAHSISKDMKFDLSSTKDYTACAAVGGALAQRSLADDIHDVIYTPRKGDKLEGKLQIVLQSVIDNGVNVNVKIKKRQSKKVLSFPYK